MTAPNDPLASLAGALDRYSAMQTAAIEAATTTGTNDTQDTTGESPSTGGRSDGGISTPL